MYVLRWQHCHLNSNTIMLTRYFILKRYLLVLIIFHASSGKWVKQNCTSIHKIKRENLSRDYTTRNIGFSENVISHITEIYKTTKAVEMFYIFMAGIVNNIQRFYRNIFYFRFKLGVSCCCLINRYKRLHEVLTNVVHLLSYRDCILIALDTSELKM